MRKNPKHNINIKKTTMPKSKRKVFEIILRGLPFEPPMSVGVHITDVDLAFLHKNGRIIVDINTDHPETIETMKSIKKPAKPLF